MAVALMDRPFGESYRTFTLCEVNSNMKSMAQPSAAAKPWDAKEAAWNGSCGLFEGCQIKKD